MKKILLLLVLLLSISLLPTSSNAKTIWDGAEVVKGQTGKMTFSKDVKVYKKKKDGEFESLVVKKGNYFRVYAIEKYNGETYYWMSSGYRVQESNLVIFKEIPLEIRTTFYENPVSIFTSRNKANILYTNYDANIIDSLSQFYWPYGTIISKQGSSTHCVCVPDDTSSWKFEPTDITIVDSKQVPKNMLVAKTNTFIYDNPLGIHTKNTKIVNKGSYTINTGLEVNGYISTGLDQYIIPSDFEVATSKGVRYTQKEAKVNIIFYVVDEYNLSYPLLSELEPNFKVDVFIEYGDKSIFLYNDVYYEIDSNLLGLNPIES